MEVDPKLLIGALYQARRAGDRIAMLACCHDDIVFRSNVHPIYPNACARLVGIDEINDYLDLVDQNWETPKHKPGAVRGAKYTFSVIIEVEMQHRSSREPFSGSKRQFWTVMDGKIKRMTQYLDENLINAIHHYARWKKDDGQA